MEILAIPNQKGGAAKTTTAMNVAATLGCAGKRVLLVDLDPQASLTRSLGIQARQNIFQNPQPSRSPIPSVEIIAGGPGLVEHEMDLTRRQDFGVLQPLLSQHASYDFVILDCPPNLYGSTANAIAAADHLLVPIPLSLQVVQSLGDTMRLIKTLQDSGYTTPPRITGVITIYRKLSVEAELTALAGRFFAGGLLETRIRQSNLYLRAEMKQVPAVLYAKPNTAPVVDHLRLCQELNLL